MPSALNGGGVHDDAEPRSPAKKRQRRKPQRLAQGQSPRSVPGLAPHTSPLGAGNKKPPSTSPHLSSLPAPAAPSVPSSPPLRRVHRCRFVPFSPSSITALAFSPASPTLAVARSNGDIDLYNTAHPSQWLCIKSIAGTGQGGVQSLMWAEAEQEGDIGRLFSAGLNGRLIEWDLLRLVPKHASDSYGGAVWAAAILRGFSAASYLSAPGGDAQTAHSPSSSSVILACEDGTLRLFDSSDPTAAPSYIKAFSRHSSRILSCAWHDPATLLSGGSDGTVRVWDLVSGRNTSRINVSPSSAAPSASSPATHVWAVTSTASSIITADSVGSITVWDLHYGTMQQRFLHHKADVLALLLAHDRSALYAASVDCTVSELRLVQGRWVMTMPLRDHTHDVMALAEKDGWLVSGGIDTVIGVRKVGDVKGHKIMPWPHRSIISVGQRALLMHQGKTLSLFQFGEQREGGEDGREDAPYTHLLDISTERAAGEQEKAWVAASLNLSCSALSPNNRWIACSSPLQAHLYHVSYQPALAIIQQDVQSILSPAYTLAFSADSSRLVSAGLDGWLRVVDVQESKLLAKARFHQGAGDDDGGQRRGVIKTLAVHGSAGWLAAGDEHNHINVFSMPALRFLHALPVHPSPHTTLTAHPSLPILIFTLASNHVHLWSVAHQGYTQWSRRLQSAYPHGIQERRERIVQVSVEGGEGEEGEGARLLLASDGWLSMVEVGKEVGADSGLHKWQKRKELRKAKGGQEGPVRAVLKFNEAERREAERKDNFRLVSRYKPLLFAAWLPREVDSDEELSELLVVECPWLRILQALPEPMARKKYGT